MIKFDKVRLDNELAALGFTKDDSCLEFTFWNGKRFQVQYIHEHGTQLDEELHVLPVHRGDHSHCTQCSACHGYEPELATQCVDIDGLLHEIEQDGLLDHDEQELKDAGWLVVCSNPSKALLRSDRTALDTAIVEIMEDQLYKLTVCLDQVDSQVLEGYDNMYDVIEELAGQGHEDVDDNGDAAEPDCFGSKPTDPDSAYKDDGYGKYL
jgi:hypothetical protein